MSKPHRDEVLDESEWTPGICEILEIQWAIPHEESSHSLGGATTHDISQLLTDYAHVHGTENALALFVKLQTTTDDWGPGVRWFRKAPDVRKSDRFYFRIWEVTTDDEGGVHNNSHYEAWEFTDPGFKKVSAFSWNNVPAE